MSARLTEEMLELLGILGRLWIEHLTLVPWACLARGTTRSSSVGQLGTADSPLTLPFQGAEGAVVVLGPSGPQIKGEDHPEVKIKVILGNRS